MIWLYHIMKLWIILISFVRGSVVQLSGYPGIDSAIITGINEYGYLRVCTSNGDILFLQPDGNTFDIMKGLICMKWSYY